ncbi:hypothetical protein FRC96_11230 [Lujinxingia vulgaris]|uniref:Abnormal spindle-like microcephaly-associated protein ASH domain-containing protein n=1 Tax=Lujinxingia vulgaris TaxID=2600176 RepID=A0A5C6X5E4_9DELT|nr:hypothetical protein [Lujinxingia vulgaris]TXD35478.1 hypothetical protein FRC96_11230 [Lujinxingia vulgaris]
MMHKPGVVSGLILGMLALLLSGCPSDDVVVSYSDFFVPWDMSPYEFDGQPELEAPARLIFADVAPGQVEVREAELTNVGRARLALESVSVEGPFELHYPEFLDGLPGELLPGESVLVQVSYRAETDEGVQGVMRVRTNDPEKAEHEVQLLANTDLPCLELLPVGPLRFGMVERGQPVERALRATNCSSQVETRVWVEALDGDGGFEMTEAADARGEERVLAAGETVLIPVTFTPTESREYRGRVRLNSDDLLEPEREVELVGEGAPPACPIAQIGVRGLEGSAEAAPRGEFLGRPLERVELTGRGSIAANGQPVVGYEWTLAERPGDTAVTLSENGDPSLQGLYLELVGRYVVELHVIDAEGTRSCEPARMVINTRTDRDIHVQLVWDTPRDSTRDDRSGSDVDLHLLRDGRGGAWNSAPWDCHWQNKTPDWGVPGETNDNPGLDIDNVTGWGPENINLNEPESGVRYRVGVYYFSDHGYGESYATVRIYLGGELQLEMRRRRIVNNQFWEVGDIVWPQQSIEIHDRVYAGFPAL